MKMLIALFVLATPMLMASCLVQTAEAAGVAGQATEAKVVEDTVAVVDTKELYNLETSVVDMVDYSDHGSVVILNNGLVIIESGLEAYEGVDGKLRFTPLYTVALQLASARESTEDLFSLLSYKDYDVDIAWNENGGATLFVSSGSGIVAELEVVKVTAVVVGSASCSVTCGDNLCNITCPKGKACLAYCDGNTPICKCIKAPASATR